MSKHSKQNNLIAGLVSIFSLLFIAIGQFEKIDDTCRIVIQQPKKVKAQSQE